MYCLENKKLFVHKPQQKSNSSVVFSEAGFDCCLFKFSTGRKKIHSGLGCRQ